MDRLDYIIKEQINKVAKKKINEDVPVGFYSDEVQAKVEKAEKRDGKDISASDEAQLRQILQSKYINLTQIALEVYPDHTEEGAQSQFRKEVLGELSDGGNEYHIKERTAKVIRKCLSELMNTIKDSVKGNGKHEKNKKEKK